MGVTHEQWNDLACFVAMYMRMRGLDGRVSHRPFDENDDMVITIRSIRGMPQVCVDRDYLIHRCEVEDIGKAAATIADIIDNRFPEPTQAEKDINRLHDYEQLGYSPKELKEIIDDRKKLKERLNSIHGASAFDVNVESLYPRIFIENIGRRHGKTLMQAEMARDMISLKAKIATLDEINKNKSKIEYVNYYKADVENTQAMYGRISRMSGPYPWGWNIPEIDNVIFNDPATIIFWKDGTKTVVKSQEGETYDPEKGLAMAISKKALGNKREYYNVFKKWLKKYNPSSRTLVLNVGDAAKGFADGIKRASEGARSLAATLRENAARENKRNAIQALKKARYNTRATKEVLKLAMEEAIRYLEKEN